MADTGSAPRRSGRPRKEGKESQYNIRAIERAIAVLNSFSFDAPDLTLRELTEKSGLSKPTVFRILSTLEPLHYVTLDSQTGQYRLGSRILELGGVANSTLTLRKVARPHLSDLQADTGATVLLGALMDDELVYVGRRESESPIRIVTNEGWRRSPHFGMLGMVLVAFQGPAEVDRLLVRSPLVGYTRHSIVERARYLERLADIRENGYVLEFNEAIEGAWGVAAPIRDSAGHVAAAVGTVLPVVEGSEARVSEVIAAVCRRAGEISRAMGFSGTSLP